MQRNGIFQSANNFLNQQSSVQEDFDSSFKVISFNYKL